MSAASGVYDCRVLPPPLYLLQTEPIQFLPRWCFLNLGLFLLLSAGFFPGSLYFIEGVLPKTGLVSRAETCLLYRQHSCGYIAHRPQITHHRGLRMTHCIPTAFLQKKKRTARSLPSVRAVSCSYRNAQLRAFLLGCILFHPDRLLGLPSPFSELQPRLPKRLQALVAWCHPHLRSACSFFNTLHGIQEGSGETRPMTDPHLMWLSSSSPLMSPVSLLSISSC